MRSKKNIFFLAGSCRPCREECRNKAHRRGFIRRALLQAAEVLSLRNSFAASCSFRGYGICLGAVPYVYGDMAFESFLSFMVIDVSKPLRSLALETVCLAFA